VLDDASLANGTGALPGWLLAEYRRGAVSFRIVELQARRAFWCDPYLEDIRAACPPPPAWAPSQRM
jgi:hypothetical protein